MQAKRRRSKRNKNARGLCGLSSQEKTPTRDVESR